DLALWTWLLRFARRCNAHDMMAAGHAIQALLQSARALYQELFDTEPLDAEWETRGLLYVVLSPSAMDHYAHNPRLRRDSFGLASARHEAGAVQELEPALKPGLAGGWHYPGDAHLRPDKLMASWHRLLEERGVAVRENCAFRGFVRQGRLARGIATAQGTLD